MNPLSKRKVDFQQVINSPAGRIGGAFVDRLLKVELVIGDENGDFCRRGPALLQFPS
jgi:hypothetical protein